MHAADAGPQHVPRSGAVRAPVERGVNLAAEDEVRLFERVIVQSDAHAGLIFDEQHAMMPGAELLVNHPLQEHAVQAAAGDHAFAAERNLARVEMTQQIARYYGIERRCLNPSLSAFQEERIALAPRR